MTGTWNTVILTLSVTMKTDRDPWEMGNAIAAFVQSALEDKNPEQLGVIDVDVSDAEIARRPVKGRPSPRTGRG